MSSDGFLLCTVYDLGAREACPPFIAKTATVMWRDVDKLLNSTPINKSEFVIAILGRWDAERLAGLDLAVPEYFTADRQPLGEDRFKEMWRRAE